MRTLWTIKRKALLAAGILNPHPERVIAKLFEKLDFFDPHDRAQVKYEMLRSHFIEGETVAEVCRRFGFSRESFYRIQQAFRERGFRALLPEKRGRKGPSKLKAEVLEFALRRKEETPDIDPGKLAGLIAERYGVELHRTTVMRAIKKKLRSSAKERGRKGRRQRRSHSGDL